LPETHTFAKVKLSGLGADEDGNDFLVLSVKPRLFDSNERLDTPRDWAREIGRLISQVTGNNAEKSWLNDIRQLFDKVEPLDAPLARNIIQICGSRRGGKSDPNEFQYQGDDGSSTSYSRFANRVNLGITTFTSLLVNNLLACIRKAGDTPAVSFIDLNINAPLFGPPGQLSLTLLRRASFGDAFANAITARDNTIIRAHAVPPNGYQENSDHFVACVRDLIETAESIRPAIRYLLIQCPTSRSGTDLEKNNDVTSLVSEYKSFGRAEAITISIPESYIKVFNEHQIPIQYLDPDENFARLSERNTAQLHDMQLISYFHASLSSAGSIQWDDQPLQHHSPVLVNYGPSRQDIAGIFIFSSVPPMYPNMLTTLLYGSLVQIIVISKEAKAELQGCKILRGQGDDIPYFPNNANGYTDPFDPKISECVGVALIRMIDTKKKLLYLLTPIPQATLDTLPHKRTVLAFGTFETPRWAHREKKYWEQQMKLAYQKNTQKAHAEDHGRPSPDLLEKFQQTLEEETGKEKRKRTYADVIAAEGDERVKTIIGTMAPKRAKQ
jgi:polynucleotide 5'-hydroxyl-kinase GRC3/NOL9